jgi:hypothetical protein
MQCRCRKNGECVTAPLDLGFCACGIVAEYCSFVVVQIDEVRVSDDELMIMI